MNTEAIGILLFIALCFGLISIDQNSEVLAVICEKNEKTTYVGLHEPPNILKLGICRAKVMPKHEYYELSRIMRRNVR